MVMVGSGGCDQEPSPLYFGVGVSSSLQVRNSTLCASWREVSERSFASIHERGCDERKMEWGLSHLCQAQILRTKGGSEHRPVSIERTSSPRGQQRGPPTLISRQHESRRGDGVHRGDQSGVARRGRGDVVTDRRKDRQSIPAQEVGDMCVSILRELGGVTDLPRLAERWSALFPRYEVSRDCQVS